MADRHLLVVSGTRNALSPAHAEVIRHELDTWYERTPGERVLIHGACGLSAHASGGQMKGVDDFAHRWAYARHVISILPMPADWSMGKLGGSHRNRAMVSVAKQMSKNGWSAQALTFPCGASYGTRGFERAWRDSSPGPITVTELIK